MDILNDAGPAQCSCSTQTPIPSPQSSTTELLPLYQQNFVSLQLQPPGGPPAYAAAYGGPPQSGPNYFNLPGPGSYPSMNPELMGTREGRDAKRVGEPDSAAEAGGDHQQKRSRQGPEGHPYPQGPGQGPPPGWAPGPGGMGPPPYGMHPPPHQMLRPGMVMVPMAGNPGVLVPMGMAQPMGPGFRPPGPRPMAPAHQAQGPPGV